MLQYCEILAGPDSHIECLSTQRKAIFKTNPDTLADFLAHDSQVFTPSEKQSLKNYREVPVDILEDRGKLLQWASKAAHP
jgi:TfoX/Sxy family transcriptional regulator of competence genes